MVRLVKSQPTFSGSWCWWQKIYWACSTFTGIAPTIHVPPVSGVPPVFTKIEDKKVSHATNVKTHCWWRARLGNTRRRSMWSCCMPAEHLLVSEHDSCTLPVSPVFFGLLTKKAPPSLFGTGKIGKVIFVELLECVRLQSKINVEWRPDHIGLWGISEIYWILNKGYWISNELMGRFWINIDTHCSVVIGEVLWGIIIEKFAQRVGPLLSSKWPLDSWL